MLQRTLPTGFIAPCLPTKTDRLPSGGPWLHEIKHDGRGLIQRAAKGADPSWYWKGSMARQTIMRSICHLLLLSAMPILKTEASLAQELSVEDRACITNAVAKLPQVAALKIEGSRAIESRILEQTQSQGRRQWNVYRVKVEIDVSVAGQRSTYVFNCIHSGQATVIQPLGMR